MLTYSGGVVVSGYVHISSSLLLDLITLIYRVGQKVSPYVYVLLCASPTLRYSGDVSAY